jgi:hypothetical protein
MRLLLIVWIIQLVLEGLEANSSAIKVPPFYILDGDKSIIRLKDYFKGGIGTNYTVSSIMNADTNTTIPAVDEKRIGVTSAITTLFQFNNSIVGLSFMNGVSDYGNGYYLYYDINAFYLISQEDIKKDQKSRLGCNPLTADSVDNHKFLVFLNPTTKDLFIEYHKFDPTSGVMSSNVTMTYTNSPLFSGIMTSIDFSKPNEFNLLLYSDKPDGPILLCTMERKDLSPATSCKLVVKSPQFQTGVANSQILAIEYDPSANLVVLANSLAPQQGHLVFYSVCQLITVSTNVQINCTVFGQKINVDLPMAKPIYLGKGVIGYFFSTFLWFSREFDYSNFERIYLSYGYTSGQDVITYSRKNSLYIGIMLRSNGSVDRFLIIDYLAKPPELYTSNLNNMSPYFKLKDNKVFYSLPGKLVCNELQDAFLKVEGSAIPPGVKNTTITVKATLNSIDTFLEFSIQKMENPLDVIAAEIPFSQISLIKGGVVSLPLNEKFVFGNDLSLAVKPSTPQVKAEVYGVNQHELNTTNIFTGSESLHQMILLWDNMVLIGFKEGERLVVCYIKTVTKEKAECIKAVAQDLQLQLGYRLKSAYLLNFQQVMVISEKIEGTGKFNPNKCATIFDLVQGKAVSPHKTFLTSTSSTNSFVIYPFSGSAVIYYFGDNTKELKFIKFTQTIVSDYTAEDLLVSMGISDISTITNIYPDFTSKNYFFLQGRLATTGTAIVSYYGYLNLIESKYVYIIGRRIENTLIKDPGVGIQYPNICASLDEVFVMEINNDPPTLKAFPYKPSSKVFEQKIRSIPFGQLGMTRLLSFDCMDLKNSVSLLGRGANDTEVYLVHYDMDFIEDPRKRVETISKLKFNMTSNDVFIMNSKSYSSLLHEYSIISKSGGTKNTPIYYVALVVKQFIFEITCPYNLGADFTVNLELSVGMKSSTPAVSKIVGVEVKPLEYSAQIAVSNIDKLNKNVGTYDLEANLLKISGHFFFARIRHSSKSVDIPSSVAVLSNRLQPVGVPKKISMGVSVEKVNSNWTMLRVADGDIEFHHESEPTKAVFRLNIQSTYIFAKEMKGSAGNPVDKMMLLVGEDVLSGARLNIFELPMNLSQYTSNATFTALLNNETNRPSRQHVIQGSFKHFGAIDCGLTNIYTIFLNRDEKSITVAFTEIGKEAAPIAITVISLASELRQYDRLCLADDSLLLTLLYMNQEQTFHKISKPPGTSNIIPPVLSVKFNFLKEKNLFVNDLECDINTKAPVVPKSKLNSTFYKCFYSTRWAEDYVVTFELVHEKETEIEVRNAMIFQKVPKVKDFSVVKTVCEGDWIISVGEYLKEDTTSRKLYFLIYSFELGNTNIMAFFSIFKSINVDPHYFHQLFSLGSGSSNDLVYLSKNTSESLTYDHLHTFKIDKLVLQIKDTSLIPNDYDLEVLDLHLEAMEKINLATLFNPGNEADGLTNRAYFKFFSTIFLISAGFLMLSIIVFIVINKMNAKRKELLGRIADFHEQNDERELHLHKDNEFLEADDQNDEEDADEDELNDSKDEVDEVENAIIGANEGN